MIMAVVGVFTITGRQNQPDSNTIAGKVNITAKPTMKVNQPSKKVNKNPIMIEISEKELKEGIKNINELTKVEDTSKMPYVIYADAEKTIINHPKGILCLNKKNKDKSWFLDTPKYNLKHFEKSYVKYLKVEPLGNAISFHNDKNIKNAYLFDTNQYTLARGNSLISEDPVYLYPVKSGLATFLKEQLGDEYVFSDSYMVQIYYKQILTGVKVTEESSTNDGHKKGELVLIEVTLDTMGKKFLSCKVIPIK